MDKEREHMELPSHPESDDAAGVREPTGRSWASRVVIAALVGLVLLVVILHLTGVVGPLSK